MPQNAVLVYPNLNPSNVPAAGKVNSAGALVVTTDAPAVTITTTQALGTIVTTNTFQVALAANPARLVGGSITNHGAAVMLVAFGTGAAGRGVQIAAGGTLFLNQIFPQEPYLGIINITGTSTQTFTTTEVASA